MITLDELLSLFLLFSFYCIAGWVWECIYMSILEKHLQNRGFLSGPYIPIYGIAGLAVYFALQSLNSPIRDVNTVKIFFIGLFFATTLEYITSVLLEKIFNDRWWDYSIYPLNLNGRICVIASLFWGFISVLFVQVINPTLVGAFSVLGHDAKLILVTIFATLMILDLITTLGEMAKIPEKFSDLMVKEDKKWVDFLDKVQSIPSESQLAERIRNIRSR